MIKSEKQVYIISSRLGVKIGKANIPKKRKKNLQTAAPIPLTLEYTIKCQHPYLCKTGDTIEKVTHGLLDQYNTSGEWFNCSIEQALATIKEVAEKIGCEIEIIDENRLRVNKNRLRVNKYGIFEGSKSDVVCRMLLQESGTTMKDIIEATGQAHYYLLSILHHHGYKIVKNGLNYRLIDTP